MCECQTHRRAQRQWLWWQRGQRSHAVDLEEEDEEEEDEEEEEEEEEG